MKKILIFTMGIVFIGILFNAFFSEKAIETRRKAVKNEKPEVNITPENGITNTENTIVIVEKPKKYTEIEQPKDPWKNATGVSYWYVWYSKGDGSTYSTQMEQPDKYFSGSLFKEENGKECFVLGFKRVHRKTLTQDDTPTGKESQWFVCVDSKESNYQFNTWVIMPHEHFSVARAKAEFSEDVFILNFERIY